jgi:hypothetical protein
VGCKADDLALQKKKIIFAKFKEVKTECNLAESSKVGSGSKKTVLPIMMMIMCHKIVGYKSTKCGEVECFTLFFNLNL